MKSISKLLFFPDEHLPLGQEVTQAILGCTPLFQRWQDKFYLSIMEETSQRHSLLCIMKGKKNKSLPTLSLWRVRERDE